MSARLSSSDAQKDMNGKPCRRKSNEDRGVQNAPVLLEGVSGYFNVPLSRMRQLDKWNCPGGFRNPFLIRRRNSLRMSPGKVPVDGFEKSCFCSQARHCSLLESLQPRLSFLFRPWLAGPYHAAPHPVREVFVQRHLDNLSSFEPGTHAYSKTALRLIQNYAGEPFYAA